MLDVLNAHDASEEDIFFAVALAWRDDAGAVDEVDAFHERDVLPHLGLPGDGRHGADALFAERVDDGGFAGVRVSDEPDGDLLAIRVQGGKLAEERDQGAFAEGVGQGGVERECGVRLREVADPLCLEAG